MTFPRRFFVAASLVGLFCGLDASAQTSVTSPDMRDSATRWVTALHQMSPEAGWVVMGGRLFRTKDSGKDWVDVTPPGTASLPMYAIYCLDATHAWTVFLDGGEFGPSLLVRIFRTKNGGRTWSPLRFSISSYADLKEGYAWPKGLLFLDAQHGWFHWKAESSAAFDNGYLFSTSDGGRTWTELSSPSGGDFGFHTLRDGWMKGGASGAELEVTHDGGRSWEVASIATPDGCENCSTGFGSYTPVFQDTQNGTFTVGFADLTQLNYTYKDRAYITRDGGNSWDDTGPADDLVKGEVVSSIGGHEIRVFANNETNLIQIRDGANIISASYPSGLKPRGYIGLVSFFDDLNGWLVYYADNTCDKLRPAISGKPAMCIDQVKQFDVLATSDGGKTFKVITPPRPPAASR